MAVDEPDIGSIEPADLLVDRAYQRIRDSILSNRLPPGSPLSVPELARKLVISRSPVREAVQRLIYDGLAVGVPYRGAAVSSVAAEDLRELYVVRELLEGLAARLATEHLDATALAELKSILDAHEGVVKTGEEARHIELDMAYHRCIREHSKNRHLNEILERIQGKAHLAQHQLWRGERGPKLALEEHRRILRAMTRGDADAAEAAARAHISRLRSRLSDVRPDTSTDNGPGAA